MGHNDYCLKPGETLEQGQWLRSKNGLFHALMQTDGNFGIYRCDWDELGYNHRVWDRITNTRFKGAGKPPYQIIMQSDGNLVIYDANKALWAIWWLVSENARQDMWAVLMDDGKFGVAQGGDWRYRWWGTG